MQITELFKHVLRAAEHLISLRAVRALGEVTLSELQSRGDRFISIRSRPKAGARLVYHPHELLGSQGTERKAVVLQGPLVLDDQFTRETVRFYRRCLPSAEIIVSTWEGEDQKEIHGIRDLGAYVMTSVKPNISGRLNVNLQSISTRAGLRKAQELDCRYVAKTRTDQRLYAIHRLSGLSQLLLNFPIKLHARPRSRVIALSWLTSKYCPLFLSDMFMYGDVEDLLDYWSPTLDERELTHEQYANIAPTINDMRTYAACSPENFLLEQYLRHIGETPDFTLRYWWTLLAERFLIVDCSMLDLYWTKRHLHREDAELALEGFPVGTTLNFLDWLQLYGNMQPNTELPESITNTSPQCGIPGPFPLDDFAR